jgi:anti-sigma factor RsiW
MSVNDHGSWSDDLPAFLIGALERQRAAELERHLESCPRCRAEARWLTPAVATLPESVARLQAPPALRQRLLAEVRADAAREGAEAPAGAARSGYRKRVAAWLGGLGSGSHGWRPIAALAALALAFVAIAGYEVGSGGGSTAGGARTVSSTHAHGVTATMVREGSGGTLRLAHVHQLPGDEVLEAWVRREGVVEAVPALFVPNREGRAMTTISDMHGVDTVMVTAEPKGGSAEPTSAPIVTMKVPQ